MPVRVDESAWMNRAFFGFPCYVTVACHDGSVTLLLHLLVLQMANNYQIRLSIQKPDMRLINDKRCGC
jgi:hypothetical protein